MVRSRVTHEPLDAGAIVNTIVSGGDGAVATFVGLVRDHNAGRRVQWLDYEAYAPLAVKSLRADRRRSGRPVAGSAPGDPPSNGPPGDRRGQRRDRGRVSASKRTRSPSCRYAIERVKQIAPIWKREYFDGGDVWIEGATADPGDEAARAAAMERACT